MTSLPSQRRSRIVDQIRQHGAVRVSDLVEQLGVSDMTIRRDLETLADEGLVEKVHGGATAVRDLATNEPGFVAKSALQRDEKAAIAAAAAHLVRPGTAIALSAGTTTQALARELVSTPELTVVTNSIPAAEVFYQLGQSDQTVVLTGGIRTPSDALVGPFALTAIRSLHVDLVFMGVHGMDPHSGYTTPNLMEAEVDRALIDAGRRLVVVADHSKWGMIGISSIARLDQADVLITDQGIDDQARELLQTEVAELIVAPHVPSVPGTFYPDRTG